MAKSDKKKFQRTSAPAKKKAAALKKAKAENKQAKMHFRDQANFRKDKANSKVTSNKEALKHLAVKHEIDGRPVLDEKEWNHQWKGPNPSPYPSRASKAAKAKKAKMLGKKKK